MGAFAFTSPILCNLHNNNNNNNNNNNKMKVLALALLVVTAVCGARINEVQDANGLHECLDVNQKCLDATRTWGGKMKCWVQLATCVQGSVNKCHKKCGPSFSECMGSSKGFIAHITCV